MISPRNKEEPFGFGEWTKVLLPASVQTLTPILYPHGWILFFPKPLNKNYDHR